MGSFNGAVGNLVVNFSQNPGPDLPRVQPPPGPVKPPPAPLLADRPTAPIKQRPVPGRYWLLP